MPLLGSVLTALLTPMKPDDSVDFDGLKSLIDFQANAEVDGLFVLGTAGQGPLLSLNERRRLAEVIVDHVAGRMQIVVHVGAMPTPVARQLARHATEYGVDAVASTPPTYYQPDTMAVSEYYNQLRKEIGDLPLLAYNNPPATGYDLRPEEAVDLLRNGVIHGVKQASADISDLGALLAGDVPVWIASADCNLAATTMGAQGGISTITNVVPELFVALHAAVAEGALDTARDRQRRITAAASRLRHPTIGALHHACSLRGLPAGQPRHPLRLPTEREALEIAPALKELDGGENE